MGAHPPFIILASKLLDDTTAAAVLLLLAVETLSALDDCVAACHVQGSVHAAILHVNFLVCSTCV